MVGSDCFDQQNWQVPACLQRGNLGEQLRTAPYLYLLEQDLRSVCICLAQIGNPIDRLSKYP